MGSPFPAEFLGDFSDEFTSIFCRRNPRMKISGCDRVEEMKKKPEKLTPKSAILLYFGDNSIKRLPLVLVCVVHSWIL
jgi:hypothetical protein